MPVRKIRGARVAQARQQKGWSQQALADRLGVARSSVARVEIGGMNPSLDFALALSAELGESVEELFGGGGG
jgi:transcriptional regulator with XRE-family HTH domain